MPTATGITATSIHQGANFYTTDGSTFYATVSVDDDSPLDGVIAGTNGLNYSAATDWGFGLVPESALSNQLFVGLGIGRDPNSGVNPGENGSPIWVVADLLDGTTPVNGIQICIDYNNDGAAGGGTVDPVTGLFFDTTLTLERLESARLYDPDGDQTALFVFVCDPDSADQSRAILSGAWGIDGSEASEGSPGLDLGTGIPNVKSFNALKFSTLVTDPNGDGLANLGDVIEYTVTIENTGFVPIATLAIVVEDFLPLSFVDYVPNTTVFDDGVTPIAFPDNAGPATPFPLDEGGANIPSPIPLGGSVSFIFSAVVTDVPIVVNEVCNNVVASTGTESVTAEACNLVGVASINANTSIRIADDLILLAKGLNRFHKSRPLERLNLGLERLRSFTLVDLDNLLNDSLSTIDHLCNFVNRASTLFLLGVDDSLMNLKVHTACVFR